MTIYPRRFFTPLEKLRETQGILILHGARQTGKTTTLQWWLERERGAGRRDLYLDCEDSAVLEVCNAGVEALLGWLRARGYPDSGLSLAIDEIQYLDDPSRFLKLLYDHYRESIRIAVSGSSSFAIKSKFRESLVGRTLPFEIFGLDFAERCRFLGLAWDFTLSWPPDLDAEAAVFFSEHAETGAYPGLIHTRDRVIKARRVRQIISAYIQSDVRELGKVRYPDRFEALVKVLSTQSGALVQAAELANTLRMARETVDEYLFLLEQTYVIRRLRPFHANLRSELTKMPKLYFEDTGVMNLGRFRDFPELDGQTLENTVFTELRKRIDIERLRYWRTSDGREVDFVVDEGRIAIEVKLRPSVRDASSLLRFRELYKSVHLVLCGMEAPARLPDEVEFVPAWRIGDWVERAGGG
jgi:predicted AAA+ superfamily ATPase